MAYTLDANGIPILERNAFLTDVPAYTQALSSIVGDHETRLNNVPTGRYVARYHHNFGNIPAGGDQAYHLGGFAFNGEAGDVWTATFSAGIGPQTPYPNTSTNGFCRLSTASGVAFWSSAMATTFIARDAEPSYATYTWRAPVANDYLIVTLYRLSYYVPALWVAADVINHGNI